MADPFADTKGSMPDTSKDDFGCDPFAVLHAPTSASQVLTPSPTSNKSAAPPRPESPSPALPPKKAKQPPPRPAPPRPLMGPTPTKPAPPSSMMSSSSDAFGDSSSGGGGFANFADFDNKNLKPAAPSPSTVLQSSVTSSSVFGSSSVLSPSPIAGRGAAAASPITAGRGIGTSPLPILLGASSATTTTNSRVLTASPALAPTLSVTPSIVPSSKTPTIAATTTTAVDFVDDPFKDYRYEDPFNIDDPFADDDGGTSSEDPFSSDSATLNNNGSLKRTAHSPKPTIPTTTNQLDDLFGDAQNNNFGAFGDLSTSTSSSSTKKPSAADPFDAFNDNFSKNTSTDKVGTKQDLMFRAFGSTENESSTANDAFFGAAAKASPFEDEFTRMDDGFAKMDISNNNNNSSSKFGATATSNDFADFDVFSNISQNFKTHSKEDGGWKRRGAVKKTTSGFEDDFPCEKKGVKLPAKFSEDYSRDDDFGADLEAVLERSKLET